MVILKLHKILSISAHKWDGTGMESLGGGDYLLQTIEGEKNPEKGIVDLEVSISDGNVDGINYFQFSDDHNIYGEPLKITSLEENKLIISLRLNLIGYYGLEKTFKEVVGIDSFLIGFLKNEGVKYSSIENQKVLLEKLAQIYLPERVALIVESGLESIYMEPIESSEKANGDNYFLGSIRIEKGKNKPIASDGKELIQLATFNFDNLRDYISMGHLKPQISFFLDPRLNDCNVLRENLVKNFTSNDCLVYESDFEEMSFGCMALYDIPDLGHAFTDYYDFSDDEIDQYEKLYGFYITSLTSGFSSNELNKLFGYPNAVQNCVGFEAAQLQDESGMLEYDKDSQKNSMEWRLLFQVSPFCGDLPLFEKYYESNIYYMIRNSDLAKGDFRNTILIFQNT